MRNNKILCTAIMAVSLVSFLEVRADQEVRPIATTSHIKEINYHSNAIHKYVGFYNYQTSIVFDNDEVVSSLSMGNSAGWQVTPLGNRLFLKPIEDNATTNATIITNKRIYHFALSADTAVGLDDPRLAYEVRFRYPETRISGSALNASKSNEIPDLSYSTGLNFKYTLYGYKEIEPLRIFDDGRFTYMKFKDINADLPAVYLVNSDGYESLVNFRMVGNYLVIEMVAPRFTLRSGEDYVCIFNENLPYYFRKHTRRSIFKLNPIPYYPPPRSTHQANKAPRNTKIPSHHASLLASKSQNKSSAAPAQPVFLKNNAQKTSSAPPAAQLVFLKNRK